MIILSSILEFKFKRLTKVDTCHEKPLIPFLVLPVFRLVYQAYFVILCPVLTCSLYPTFGFAFPTSIEIPAVDLFCH